MNKIKRNNTSQFNLKKNKRFRGSINYFMEISLEMIQLIYICKHDLLAANLTLFTAL